ERRGPSGAYPGSGGGDGPDRVCLPVLLHRRPGRTIRPAALAEVPEEPLGLERRRGQDSLPLRWHADAGRPARADGRPEDMRPGVVVNRPVALGALTGCPLAASPCSW